MKKKILTLVLLLCAVLGTKAMTYNQAREQAAFLTDKMAYELNLTDEQYDAAYEINLDYLMSVNSVDDIYSDTWQQRNYDMQEMMYDWQWEAFCDASYFYRPVYWDGGVWHFGIYAHYPRRDYYFFDRPPVFYSYRGGHSWRSNGGRSWYQDHRSDFRRGGTGMRDARGGRSSYSSGAHFRQNSGGMRSYANGNSGGMRSNGNSNSNSGWRSSGMQQRGSQMNGGMRQSSTRSTVGNSGSYRSSGQRFGGSSQRQGSSHFGGGGSSNGGGAHFGGGHR